jgi:hypothetical protein
VHHLRCTAYNLRGPDDWTVSSVGVDAAQDVAGNVGRTERHQCDDVHDDQLSTQTQRRPVNESSRRRIGRPPLDERESSINVTFRVTPTQFDRLYAQAQRERTTMSEVARRALSRACRSASGKENE